jgi:hypothetical protein
MFITGVFIFKGSVQVLSISNNRFSIIFIISIKKIAIKEIYDRFM